MEQLQQFKAIRLLIQSTYKQDTVNWINKNKGSITDWMSIAFPERLKTDIQARKFITDLSKLSVFHNKKFIKIQGQNTELFSIDKNSIKILEKMAYNHAITKEVNLLYDVKHTYWKNKNLNPILLE